MIVDGLGSGLFAVCVSNYDKKLNLSVSDVKTFQRICSVFDRDGSTRESELMKVQKFK